MISVIIPIYNCEENLSVCLNSVLRQTHRNLEIICIDDSSADSTPEILDDFKMKDSRVKTIRNDERRGLGQCRNQGLDMAMGKYVLFLEPSDWIFQNTLERLYLKSEELRLDVLIFKAIIYEHETDFNVDRLIPLENTLIDPQSLLNDIPSPVWAKFYNRTFIDINNIGFSGQDCDERAFNLDVLLNARRTSFLNEHLYYHKVQDCPINEKDIVKIADEMIKKHLNNNASHKDEILKYVFNFLNDCYERADDKSAYLKSTSELLERCFDEYGLKEDIIRNIDRDILIRLKSDSLKYLAIDVGGTAIKYTVIDEAAEIFKINERATKRDEDGLYRVLDDIIQPNLNRIDGIALSFPGRIDVEKGIVHAGGPFKWIHDLGLKAILEEKYSKRVWIENDGKCNALAELWKGNLLEVKSGVIIGLGTGIAGGIVINGELYRGINGSAGEFSHVLENLNDPDKSKKFTEIGGYESLIGSYAKMNSLESADITGREFFEKYHSGDETTMAALKDYAKIISSGIINIQTILDVEKFCIGGGISAQDALIEEIRKTVHDYFAKKASKAIREPEIERCHFGNSAGCVGALYNFLVMEKSFKDV